MKFDDKAYDFSNIPKLSEEDSKSPFAEFYYAPVTPPAPDIAKAYGEEQLPVSDTLDFGDIERIFLQQPGLKNGWCILPDGTAYSSIETTMPEVSLEIESWWNNWIMDSSYNWLNYRIWIPGLHKSHAMPIMENLGWGMCEITMFQPLFPSILLKGRRPEGLNDNFVAEMGASGFNVLCDDPEKNKFYSTLISCIKKDGDGIKVQTVNYMGMKWEDGRMLKVHDVEPERARLFLMHNAYEFHHKAEIATALYEKAKTLPNRGLNPNIKPILP